MAVTRHLTNGNEVVDWVDEVNEVPNQYGWFNGSNLFEGKGVSTNTVLFDKNTRNNSMLPQVNRVGGEAFHNKDRDVSTYSVALPYFLHTDYVTPDDIQGWRKAGTPDQAEDFASVMADKIEDMRFNADQSREYMKINAIKGDTVDPEGNTVVDMFTELGETQKEIDFKLGTATTDIDGKIAEMKRYVAKNAKIGGAIGRTQAACSPEFFDAFVKHPNVKSAYQMYQNSGKQLLRDDLSMYERWGIVDVFEHKGVTFFAYDATFTQPDGTSVRAFGTTSTEYTKQVGYSIISGVRGLYRAYYGPTNTLTGANSVGREMYLYQYRDPKDKYLELELEMAPLYMMTKPLASVKLKTTT